MEQKSIYSFIQEILDTMPAIPYEFQNNTVNGFKEADYILKDRYDIELSEFLGHRSECRILKYNEKEDLSKKLIDLILIYIFDKDRESELRNFLYRHPLYTFMDVFQMKFKSYLNFDEFDHKSVYNLGLNMAMNSIDYELTALGMLILGFFENDFSRKVIRVLGLHSMFTAYAVDAYSNFNNSSVLIFDLVKNTMAYGKIAALASFSPISIEEMNWTVMNGYEDSYVSGICSSLILQKPEVSDSLADYIGDPSYLNSISSLFAYGLEKTEFISFDCMDACFEKYIDSVIDRRDFVTLASFIAIEKHIGKRSELLPSEFSVSGWKFKSIFMLTKKIKSLIDSYHWNDIVISTVKKKSAPLDTIVSVLKRLHIKPKFELIKSILEDDKFNPGIADFIFKTCPEFYLRDGLSYTKYELRNPFGDLFISSNKGLMFSSDYAENEWLKALLSAMNSQNLNDEDFFLECLESKSVDVRLAALKCLHDFYKGWSKSVVSRLEILVHYDSSSIVRREMNKLITMGKEAPKIRRYLNIDDIEIKPSENDKKMFETDIAGTLYHDLSEVENQIKEDSILYLIEEELSDRTVIAVTDESGYRIGFVHEEDTNLILPLLDSGNTVYGRFLGESLKDSSPKMSIIVNKIEFLKKGVIPLSFNRIHDI